MTALHPVEGDVKNKVKALLKKHGWFTFMPASNTYGSNGISDHLAVKNGILFAIEAKLKTSKGGTKDNPVGTPLQEKFLQSVRDAGGMGMVVNAYNLDKFEDMLRRIDLKMAGPTTVYGKHLDNCECYDCWQAMECH